MSKVNGKHRADAFIAEGERIELGDEELRKRCPVLFSLLDARWKEGRCVHAPPRVSFTPTGGCWQMCIGCASEKRDLRLFVSALGTCWDEAEQQLASGRVVPLPNFAEQKRLATAKPKDVG